MLRIRNVIKQAFEADSLKESPPKTMVSQLVWLITGTS